MPVLDVLDVPGAIVLKGRAGTEASGYRMVIVPSRGTSAAIVGSIDPDGEVVVGAVTREIVGNTAHVTVWAFDDDRNLVQESATRVLPQPVCDKPSVTSATSAGCIICRCVKWDGGYHDSGCLTGCLAGCHLLGGTPQVRAACVAACYVACYVPEYCAKYECFDSQICPQ